MRGKKSAHLVCTQSIGFPTYWRVVTAIENVINNITVAFVCRRNTGESILTWDTYSDATVCLVWFKEGEI